MALIINLVLNYVKNKKGSFLEKLPFFIASIYSSSESLNKSSTSIST
jgi:hypothetical protein